MASRAAYGCALPSRCSQVQCGIAVEPRETRAGSRLALKFVRKASDGALGLGHITRSQRHPVSGHGKVFSVISEIGKTRIANSMRQECLLKETKQQQSESLSLMTTSTSSLRHATPCFQTTTDLQVRLLKRHLSVGRQVLLAASTAITTGSFSPSFTSAALTAVTNPSAVLAVSDTAEQLQSAGGDDITTSAAVASAISAGVAGSGLDPVSNGVVSVVFAVAVLGLVVVTGGVRGGIL